MNNGLMDALKVIVGKRMERMIEGLLGEDAVYRKLSKSACSIERIYDALNLNPDIKIVTDQLLVEGDEMNVGKTSLAYWTGMMDTVAILRNMDIVTPA